MTTEFADLTGAEQNAIITLCIMAAFADENVSELERAEIKKIVENFSDGHRDLTSLFQSALSKSLSMSEVVRPLASARAKALAYEMAACVCNADSATNAAEQKFLTELRVGLGFTPERTSSFDQNASQLREAPPVIGSAAAGQHNETDSMIRENAIIAGALELMPQRLATMAIVPLQMRMVYKIGKTSGYELDLNHTKEFFGTIGVGLTSQVVDGYLSKMVGQVTKRFMGRFAGALASQATESAIAFATTYAIGQVAKTYYQSGRTISAEQLRQIFSSMLNEGRSLQGQYGGDIAQRARSLKVSDFLPIAA